MKKDYLKILPIILLALAIGLSPSFSAGKIEGGRVLEIRVEDILMVVFGLVWITNFLISGRKRIEKPPLFFPILMWLSIGLFSVLLNWILANITFSQGFFFFLKEVEIFFLYFYIFYHIKNIDSVKFLIKIWIFLVLVNIGWIVYEIITGVRLTSHYGPTPFIEPEGPFPAGAFFLIIFIFLLNIFLFYYLDQKGSIFKNGILAAMIISPIAGLISSGSRVSFFGLIFSLFFTLLLYYLRKGILKSFFVGFLFLLFFAVLFLAISFKEPGIKRLINTEKLSFELSTESYSSRMSIWENQMFNISKHPLFIFFGLGKSFLFEGQQSHSQYIKNLVETGIIGSLSFLFLIFIIIKKSFQGFTLEKNPLSIGLSAGLFVATLTMLFISIPGEAFLIVKPNEAYWFFVALTMVTIAIYEKEKIKEIPSN